MAQADRNNVDVTIRRLLNEMGYKKDVG